MPAASSFRKIVDLIMKNIIFLFIVLSVCSCRNNSQHSSSVIISPQTNQKIILSAKMDSLELSHLTKSNLRLLRNEIFARHGYIFKSQELTDYFSTFGWYKPNLTIEKVYKQLTKIDRYNISLIKAIEKEKKQNSIKWESEIQLYLDLIPKIELPIDFNCENGFDIPELDYDVDLIKKYKPEGTTIIGKLYQNKEEVAILYGYAADIFYPLISVIDKSGKESRETRLFELRNCGDDAGYEATTYGTITEDLKIKTKSITVTWDVSSEDAVRDTIIVENIVEI